MDCEDAVYSENYYDLIIEYGSIGANTSVIPADCRQEINVAYSIGYFNRERLPELNISDYTYSAIPQCFTLMDDAALSGSGILKVQNQPTLSLKGEGILIGFLDTGIDYRNPVFQSGPANTRILSIWDQTIRSGKKPEGFLYGSEYTRNDINAALRSDNPLEIVPSVDENGHGTFLAGVAAGSPDSPNDFSGAAPYADIAVVKLKPAKQNIRDFYFIPTDAVAYQENDVMAAVAYLNKLAMEENRPLVLCIGLGTSMGSYDGTSPLSMYLNEIATLKNHVVVIAAGNEANARHHFYGSIMKQGDSETVEINVGENVRGFTAELWARAPELYSVAIISPTGEQIRRIPVTQRSRVVYQFIFEETVVSVEYQAVGVRSGDLLVFFRFDKPMRGLWQIVVYAEDSIMEGHYHIWLPLREFMSGDVIFIRSNPDATLTVPSTSEVPMTAGAYDVQTGSLFLDSSRGFTAVGDIKPDYVAPGVNVYGPDLRNRYTTRTGTSAAAAVAAGGSALLLEWAIKRQYEKNVNSVNIKNYILRGARREESRTYPNEEWGYGELDIYEALNKLRVL